MTDQYTTISQTAEGFYSEKRSKFLAFAHHVETAEEAKAIIDDYRKKYYDARHCCYAYVLGAEGHTFRANDDGEPSSTAGKPILGQIQSHGLTDVLVCVIRYYGGVNLGTGGLIVAYRTAAADALDHCTTEVRLVEERISYDFSYPMMNAVMQLVKHTGARIIAQDFNTSCSITLGIRRSEAAMLRERLRQLSFE